WARCQRTFRRLMIHRESMVEQSDDSLSIPPCPFQNLVRRPVEIEFVNETCLNHCSGRRLERHGTSHLRSALQSYPSFKVPGQLRFSLVRQGAGADQFAVSADRISLVMK